MICSARVLVYFAQGKERGAHSCSEIYFAAARKFRHLWQTVFFVT